MQDFDLIIIGTGSGNSILSSDFDDMNVALVEKGVFGGTCLNVGCIPSKMFVYAAEIAEHARHGERLGLDLSFNGADWPKIRDRVFDRIDPIAAGGEQYRVEECGNVTVFKGEGKFIGPKRLAVNDEIITADTILVAAGARSFTPDVPGLAETGYHTSDTIMRVDELPEHLIVLGGGFIASEMSHVFGGLGSKVTIVNRGSTLLKAEDDDIRLAFTEAYRTRFDVLTDTQILEVRRTDSGVEVDVSVLGDHRTLVGDQILVAMGRVPNGDSLCVTNTGVEVDHQGYVVTDEYMRTNVDGIWALGDVTNPAQLKHTANAEAKIVAHNIIHPDDLQAKDLSFTPSAVFGYPQVASVGMKERDCRLEDIPYVVKIQHYGDVAYGWAMEDDTSFVKLIAHEHTRELIGAHIIGPQASTLLQQLVQGMRFGQTVDEMATGQIWTHPALPEVIENALLGL